MNNKNTTILSVFVLLLSVLVVQSAYSTQWTPQIWQDFLDNGAQSALPDFSYAGYGYGEETIPNVETVVDVTYFGAVANDGIDDYEAIQTAIAYAGTIGGGAVYFPAGEYTIDTSDPNSFIKINHSNVVLRGAGESSTILHFKNMDYETTPDVEGFIRIGSNLNPASWGTELTAITADAARGSDILEVADTSGLQVGSIVHITMRNTNGLPNLTEYLISPLEIETAWTNAYNSGVGYTYFRWLVEISEIVDSTHIRLKQPLRENILTLFEPLVRQTRSVDEVGIENMTISSDWQGDGMRSENNYWPRAVVFTNSNNSWLRNVTIDEFSIGVNMQFCKNITVKDVVIDGQEGDFGVLTWGHDCMVENITVNAQRRKALSIHNYSQGNVMRNVLVNYTSSGTTYTQGLDYHCNYSLENLMENITNARSSCGGSSVNYPNSSHRNTFWNVKADDMAPVYDAGNEKEFFANHYYRSGISYARKDAHKLMPQSIVVGVYHDTIDLEIEGSTLDRNDGWIYVEGLNQPNVNPSSLYEAQFAMRVQCVEFLPGDLNQDCTVDFKDFSIMASQWLSSVEE